MTVTLEQAMNDGQKDDARWSYEQNRAMAERAHDLETDFTNRVNEAAVTAGNHTLRALILINGGAAITMLAFIGHLVSAAAGAYSSKISEMTGPLIWFAWGVAAATFGLAMAYFTNYSIAWKSGARSRHYEHPYVRNTAASKRWHWAGVTFQILAVVAGIASLVLFVFGMFGVRDVVGAIH